MADHFYAPTRPVAAKEHRCVACLHRISKGEKHVQQSGYLDSRAFRNRFHEECWKALSDDGEFEFIPGDLDPPARLAARADQGSAAA